MTKDLRYQLSNITRDFEKFRLHNDLDRLFAKGIDVAVCKKVLSSMKDLMVESDWHIINKEVVEKMHPRDVQLHLTAVVNDYERASKKKMDSIMSGNETEEDKIKKKVEAGTLDLNSAPMALHTFAEEIEIANEE